MTLPRVAVQLRPTLKMPWPPSLDSKALARLRTPSLVVTVSSPPPTTPWRQPHSGHLNSPHSNFILTRRTDGIAQANWEGDTAYLNDYRPDGGSGANFNFGLDLTATDPKTYANASVAQLFYTANM